MTDRHAIVWHSIATGNASSYAASGGTALKKFLSGVNATDAACLAPLACIWIVTMAFSLAVLIAQFHFQMPLVAHFLTQSQSSGDLVRKLEQERRA